MRKIQTKSVFLSSNFFKAGNIAVLRNLDEPFSNNAKEKILNK